MRSFGEIGDNLDHWVWAERDKGTLLDRWREWRLQRYLKRHPILGPDPTPQFYLEQIIANVPRAGPYYLDWSYLASEGALNGRNRFAKDTTRPVEWDSFKDLGR